MQRQGMICDLAHASETTAREVLRCYPRLPVLISHGGIVFGDSASKKVDPERNISLELARLVASRGGVIGVGIWPAAVGSAEPEDTAAMILKAVKDPWIGPKHVALGSDMDGSVVAAFSAKDWCLLTDQLRGHLTERQLRDVMGGNVLRFFQRHLPSDAG